MLYSLINIKNDVSVGANISYGEFEGVFDAVDKADAIRFATAFLSASSPKETQIVDFVPPKGLATDPEAAFLEVEMEDFRLLYCVRPVLNLREYHAKWHTEGSAE